MITVKDAKLRITRSGDATFKVEFLSKSDTVLMSWPVIELAKEGWTATLTGIEKMSDRLRKLADAMDANLVQDCHCRIKHGIKEHDRDTGMIRMMPDGSAEINIDLTLRFGKWRNEEARLVREIIVGE